MLKNHKEFVDFGEVKISLLNGALFDIDVDSSFCRNGIFHFNINY